MRGSAVSNGRYAVYKRLLSQTPHGLKQNVQLHEGFFAIECRVIGIAVTRPHAHT